MALDEAYNATFTTRKFGTNYLNNAWAESSESHIDPPAQASAEVWLDLSFLISTQKRIFVEELYTICIQILNVCDTPNRESNFPAGRRMFRQPDVSRRQQRIELAKEIQFERVSVRLDGDDVLFMTLVRRARGISLLRQSSHW